MSGNQFDHVDVSLRRIMCVPDNYTSWVGRYIDDKHVPLFKNFKSTCEFLLNSMYIGLPWFYATNTDVLKDIGRILDLLDISYKIEEFDSIYVLRADGKIFNVLERIASGN